MNNTVKVIFISLMFFAVSCSNDFELNAPYQDIPVVYGLIDPSRKVNYILINRAFLTEGNVLDAAGIPDSTNYPYKLLCTIKEYNSSNQLVRTFVLDTVHLPRPNGVFGGGQQPYYKLEVPGFVNVYNFNEMTSDTVYFTPEHKLKLTIENPVNGKIIESETYILANINLKSPAPFNRFVSFTGSNRINIEMSSVKYGRLYEVKFRFFYREVNVFNPSDTVLKYLDWYIGSARSERITGMEDISISYIPNTFFNVLKQRIPADPEIKRFVGNGKFHVQLIVSVATDEFMTYYDSNKPSTSLSQMKPIYTNISNGIGLFTSRRTMKFNYFLNYLTMDSLRNGSVSYLNFQ